MKTINLTAPKSWTELSDKQLEYLFTLIAESFNSIEVKTLCLFRFTGIKVITRYKKKYFVKIGRTLTVLSPEDVASMIQQLDWIEHISEYPVRLSQIKRNKAVPADLEGVTFGQFLYCDNLYQGFLATKSNELIKDMAKVLYGYKKIKLKPYQITSIFYWWASVKIHFSQLYPNLFAESSPEGAPSNPREVMNTQIRALTKGDITKESEILNMECARALTELDAQAKEYNEINKKYGK